MVKKAHPKGIGVLPNSGSFVISKNYIGGVIHPYLKRSLAEHTYSCNSRTNFPYEVHAMTKKWKSTTTFPHIVSALKQFPPLNNFNKFMYCDLWISKFKKEQFPQKLYEEIQYTNLLTLAWKIVKSNQVNLFLAGFSYLEPLCDALLVCLLDALTEQQHAGTRRHLQAAEQNDRF